MNSGYETRGVSQEVVTLRVSPESCVGANHGATGRVIPGSYRPNKEAGASLQRPP